MASQSSFNRKQIFLVGFVFILLAIIFVTRLIEIIKKDNQFEPLKEKIVLLFSKEPFFTQEKEPRLLDGVLVLPDETNFLPVAVMIDNFPQSRPADGLERASVIYEAPVEAGITRFLVVFDFNSLPVKIGPVRSARPYFADWAEEYRSLFIHAGGSPEVIKQLKQNYYQVYNLDDLSQASIYFERDQLKIAPFNLFITKEKISSFLTDRKILNQGDFAPWLFLTDKKLPTDIKISQIKVNFKEPVIWQYNLETNSYLRIQNGSDRVEAKNLVVQITDISVIDEIGRRKIRTDGRGEAFIFQNGEIINGYWQKPSMGQRTKFYSLDNQEILFNPGLTWIEMVGSKSWVEF